MNKENKFLLKLEKIWRKSLNKYLSNQKLWKIIKERDMYYYEIRLAGTTIDRIPVEYPVLKYLKKEGVINDHRPHASNLS